MTGLQLAVALETAGISQSDLARRLFVGARAVRWWIAQGVPPKRVAAVKAALALRPRIFLTHAERERIAELLELIESGHYRKSEWLDAQRLRVKVRAGLGGAISDP